MRGPLSGPALALPARPPAVRRVRCGKPLPMVAALPGARRFRVANRRRRSDDARPLTTTSDMNDPLYNKILDGLDRLTDREKFEACAADLLRKDYPRLVSVAGGSDAGYDGVAQQADGERIQLVCTTGGDTVGNLRGNLEEARKKGRESDSILFVTSRKLSPQQKEKLRACAAEFGKRLYPVYDQEPVVNLLYHNSRWRKDLLGISGHPPALSLIPINHRPTFGLSPIGRGSEIGRLTSATGDLVLVGQPGAGKTSLLAHVAATTGGYFVVTNDRTAIADGVRDQSPKWLIIDDAASRIDELVALQQIRASIGKDFRIVAACWPGQDTLIASKLQLDPATSLVLLPLPMAEIRQIVSAMDINGPDFLVHEILHQSAGKPGLAVTLCQICFTRGTRALLTADALLQDVKNSLDALAGQEAVGLLAHFALAGDNGMTVEQAAEATGLAPVIVQRLTESMGAAGVLEVSESERLAVDPARLRQGLVRDMFGRRPYGLDWEKVIRFVPDRADAIDTLVASAILGGKFDDVVLQREIESLRGTRRFAELCEHYARIGPVQSRWVLANYPELAESAAEPLLAHIPSEVIPALLRADLTRGPWPQQERDELKSLRKWIDEKASHPTGVPRRLELLGALETMRDELKDTPTLLAGVRHVIGITFELMTNPPGEPAAIVLHHGFVPIGALRQIVALWPRIEPLLQGLSTALARRLPRIIADWVYPRPMGNVRLAPAFLAECKAHALTMVASLTAAYRNEWTVLYGFEDFAERVGCPIGERPGLAGILFPKRARGRAHELDKRQHEAVHALGDEWARRGPEAAFIADWLRIDAEARGSDINYPNYGRELAWRIAEKSAQPQAWLDALVAANAPAFIVDFFADRCCRGSVEFATRFVTDFLPREAYRGVAIECLVRYVPVTDPVWNDAHSLLPPAAGAIGHLVLRNHVSDETILHLLTSCGDEVAGSVAVNAWSADPDKTIPDVIMSAWRAAVVNHVEDEYQLEEIAATFPDLGCAWLKQRVNQTWEDRLAGEGAFESYHCLNPLIKALGKGQRREVIDHFKAGNHHSDVLAALVGQDEELFLHSRSRPATARLGISCLGPAPEGNSDVWVRRALALLEAGVTEEEVFYASQPMRGGNGPESRLHEESLKRFRPLQAHPDIRIQRIANTAVAQLTQMRDDALQRERAAAVKGKLI